MKSVKHETQYKELVVGGRKYTTSYFMAGDGILILGKLTKLLGVPIATLISQGRKGDIFTLIPQAVQALCGRLNEPEVLELLLEVLSTTDFENQVVGERVFFDSHFQGRIGKVFELVTKVTMFQFDDFLSVAISAGALEMAKQAKAPQSTSNG